MPQMRYAILKLEQQLEFVEMPASYSYQLTALHLRLHKELEKLTADVVPQLPHVIAECDNLELVGAAHVITQGLAYINRLEQTFAGVQEKAYPLISLLTEIRALQAQLEQWYEEEWEA
ncbi:hydrolase/acyltransferase [Paenibacillus sp. N3.4]|uniref:hydrolase/acyltransferase n=1 Tax=Paenibacillus sp. N3.4 TaxID=2603222 RepID=UPI0011C76E12|nr:hydrolase/acyltransferase [Paenibacillus sp. N3.4]TXK71826.1 hydrolase/acyltransferase [Paenibacillus sp. N3.4]